MFFDKNASTMRSMFGKLAVVAALAAVPVTLAAPAHAGGLTALQRCQASAAPNETQTTIEKGTQVLASFPFGNNPPNEIFPGDVVRVTVTGTVGYDAYGDTVGPKGTQVPAPPTGWPFAGMSKFSSVANWNNNPGGWVGQPMETTSLAACTPAPKTYPVRLLYYMNDPQLSDNSGAWTIKTDLYYG